MSSYNIPINPSKKHSEIELWNQKPHCSFWSKFATNNQKSKGKNSTETVVGVKPKIEESTNSFSYGLASVVVGGRCSSSQLLVVGGRCSSSPFLVVPVAAHRLRFWRIVCRFAVGYERQLEQLERFKIHTWVDENGGRRREIDGVEVSVSSRRFFAFSGQHRPCHRRGRVEKEGETTAVRTPTVSWPVVPCGGAGTP
ncbi:hypothetical protein L3X38_025982 [Prunus dulcis]|uniref:Uncharacterized protein n=1 Tax=Prunus dulcis TaxID=3755 RepID=A0AAD4W3W1_PRUDU|nr:hypothetical protein L3X38_025982 [Prunus dulcis]